MKTSSIFLSLSVALFVVLVNQVDESEAIFIPIIKPDLRYLSDKKKQLLSFINVPAVLQILGQVFNLNAIMQHFGLAPPAAPAPAAVSEVQRGSGSANLAAVVPPPTTSKAPEPDCDDDDNDDDDDGGGSTSTMSPTEASQDSQKISTVQDSSQETITEAIASDEGSQETDSHGLHLHLQQHKQREASVELDDETPPKSAEDLTASHGNGIEVEFRRRKLEGLRQRYLFNALERLRKI